MKLVAVSLLLLVVMVVTPADVRKLKKTPRGINVADWNECMGRWYLYANIQPCSWSGEAEFTNWAVTYVMNKDRKGSCSKTEATCTPTSADYYTTSDSIGDLWSGKAVIVDGDKRFQNYAIRWGCTKYLGEECADYWTSVAKINRKLAELLDTSLSEMV